MIAEIRDSGAEDPISMRISPIEMEIGTGSETDGLELFELAKLYNSSSGAGTGISATGEGTGSEGMESGTISGITDLRYSSLAMCFQ